MSSYSPRRQPLSLVHNKSNSTASTTSSTAGSGSDVGNSSTNAARKKHPSISALTALHTSPKASLETSREGRASLSFSPFEPFRLPGASDGTASGSGTSVVGVGKTVRARATTVSSASSTLPSSSSFRIHPSTPHGSSQVRSPPRTVAALGPARRTRSKTLSKSHSHAVSSSILNRSTNRQRALSQDEDSQIRRQSCSFVENDNLQKTLDLLEQHAEEQGRRLSLSSSSASSNAANTGMLSAPLMQRSPVTPVSASGNVPSAAGNHAASSNRWSNGSLQASLSPPTLLPPYMPTAADLELVFPTTSPRTSLASSTSSQSSSVCQATLTPQVEQLSNLISDLSLFLPRADSLSSDQLTAIQTAVDSILGKTPTAPPPSAAAVPLVPSIPSQTTLGHPIELRNDNTNNLFADDMPTFYIRGLPSSLHETPPINATQSLYDPSTPPQQDDVDMLDVSTTSTNPKLHYSHGSQQYHHPQPQYQVDNGTSMENMLQVQHDPPPYEARINFSNLDYDPGLAPPRW